MAIFSGSVKFAQMKSGLRIVISLAMLFAVSAASARTGTGPGGVWSGSLNFTGGTGFDDFDSDSKYKYSNFLGEGSARLGWKGEKFSASAGFSISDTYAKTITFTATARQSGQEVTSLSGDIGSNLAENLATASTLNLLWTPSDSDSFGADLSWITSSKDFSKGTLSMDMSGALSDPDAAVSYLTYGSEGYGKTGTFGAKARWKHVFENPRQEFLLRLETSLGSDDQSEVWEKGSLDYAASDSDYGYNVEKSWRTTPLYRNREYLLSGRFSDRKFCSVEGLDADFSLEAVLGDSDDDYNSAVLAEEKWEDTPSGCGFFRYRKLTVNPVAHVRWTSGGMSLEATLTPQWFLDFLSSDDRAESLTHNRLDLLADLAGSYAFGGGHSLKLSFTRSLTRPTYLNLCWFARQGTQADELIQGNSSLDPAFNDKLTLGYSFKAGRFSSELNVGYLYRKDNLESTFHYVDALGVRYVVYTWINAGWSGTSDATLSLRWQGESLKASLNGKIGHYRGVTSSGSESRSFDYSLNGDVSYTLAGSWIFLARGRWQSDIIRTYTSRTGYVGCDVRIEKRFGNKRGFGVFVEGRDLFDKDIVTSTYSEDFSYVREVSCDYNRRKFLLGVSVRF